jgi:sugar phosphate isomerase/epimerase
LSKSRLAVTLYTLREFTQTPADIARTLHKVKAIGYDYVQFSALGPVDPHELKTMLDSEGMGVCATHVSYDRLQNDMQGVIDEHHLWSCRHVAIPVLPEGLRNHAAYAEFARQGSEIARRLAEAGLTFSYHNHHLELEKKEGRTGLEVLFGESDPRLFLAEIDTYWVQCGGGDPAAWIRRMSGREPLVHFKDMGVYDGKPGMAEIGEGNLNWPAILEACRAGGVEWYIVEQDVCRRDPFESIAISLRNLKAMGLS